MKVAQAIDWLRESQKMSDKAIADKVGTTQPTIYRIRNGQNCSWTLGDKIMKLKDSLNP